MDSQAVVSVDDLHKVYANGVEALNGITFHVEPGEVFGLLGPNGAGKSTTVGVLTTTVTPTAGSATVSGHDVVGDPLAVRRSIGVAFQQSVLEQSFSGLENLRLHARLWRMPPAQARARIAHLLDRMGLAARADDGVRYLEEAEDVCDRVAVIHDGRIAAIGPPTALIEELGGVMIEVRVLRDAGAAADALRDLGLASRPPLVADETVALPMRERPPELAHMLADLQADGLGVAATTVRATTLNDVYLHLTAATEARA